MYHRSLGNELNYSITGVQIKRPFFNLTRAPSTGCVFTAQVPCIIRSAHRMHMRGTSCDSWIWYGVRGVVDQRKIAATII